MTVIKPSLPKGTRDFLPQQVVRRKFIFSTIEEVFTRYGYLPIETPVFENLSTLTGRYGEEGDKLLFKVLNNGDYLNKADQEAFANQDSGRFTPSIAKRGLRYDLTVPFARFVVMNQNEIQIPFKRYQIQPVWRADRPQKGRYQEFYQCDADVVGSESLVYEAELTKIYKEVFEKFKLPVKIHINNRKILFGLSQVAGLEERFMDMTTAVDKLDKIGVDGVRAEMTLKEFPEESVEKVLSALKINDLDTLGAFFEGNEIGSSGVSEITTVMGFLSEEERQVVRFDITLARGLSYYTGCIFEVKLDAEKTQGVVMGSLGGGGRYADLTESFGLKDMPGVGISFGAERIYDIMEELDLYPESVGNSVRILMVYFEMEGQKPAFDHVTSLRNSGISADIYPDAAKMKKQLKYASDRGIPYVGIIGGDEISTGHIMLKDLRSGEQNSHSIDQLIDFIKNN